MDNQRPDRESGSKLNRRWLTVSDLSPERLGPEVTLAELKAKRDEILAAIGLSDSVCQNLDDTILRLEKLTKAGDAIHYFSAGNVSGFAVARDGIVVENFATVVV